MSIWQFDDYQGTKGNALSVQVHIKDMKNGHDDFPADVRTQAVWASIPLRNALQELAEKQRVQRNLITGSRLDPRKRRQVGTAMRRGRVDVNELRPYQRRSLTLDLPTIGIIGSAGVRELNDDRTYVQRISQLVLALGWACEMVGTETTAVLCEGHYQPSISRHSRYRQAQLIYKLLEPSTTTPLQAFQIMRNTSTFYRQAFATAYDTSTREDQLKLCSPQNKRKPLFWDKVFPGDNGGYGVEWMRHFIKPDIVIGIGNLLDVNDADISLRRDFSVDEAVQTVIDQIRAIR